MPRNGFRKEKRISSMQHDPLVLEMDYTKADIFVVDPKSGKPCKPWQTIITDMNTRMIVGFFLKSRPPKIRSFSELLRKAITFKPNGELEFKFAPERWRFKKPVKLPFFGKGKGFSPIVKGEPT